MNDDSNSSLSVEFARRRPAEYVARYQRLPPGERVSHVAALDDDGLLAHLDAYLATIRQGRRLLRFHVVVSPPVAEERFLVSYAAAFEGETYDTLLGELDVTPSRFACLRGWMAASSAEAPWLVVKPRRRTMASSSFDERLARGASLFPDARAVEVLLGLAEPWSERGESPRGTVALAVRSVDVDSANVLVILLLDDDLSTEAYSNAASAAQAWADKAAARYDIPCVEPSGFLWSRLRSR